MYKLAFTKNEKISLGVEIEVQLINPVDGNLKSSGISILNTLLNKHDIKHIKSELFQSMLEIETPICSNAFEVGSSLRHSLNIAKKVANDFDTKIMMAGTHPFTQYTDGLLTPNSRYFALIDRYKWITRRLQIFGLHIHL